MPRTIYLANQSTVVTAAQFTACVAALFSKSYYQFCPAWGLAPVVIQQAATVPNAECVILLDTTNDATALGYHEYNGPYPRGYAFAKTALAAGVPWQVVLDHEVSEQTLDPWCIDCMLCTINGQQVAAAKESSDPCESDTYTVFGQPMSNFVLPAWFVGGSGPYDWLGKLKAPLSIDAGGYFSYLPFAAGSSWVSVMGQNHDAASHSAFSRYQRRRACKGGPASMRIAA